ncbi:helix-turn-helix domain-containing protein [Paenibacillus qinlingensis]|uniref:helix-turn-helix domain-containing protein n=1 Tax=Paenibacillus qinlingensis TaxID=1837343 RepID=UPI001564B69C|nr:AraC family transcriptional regulator [Paenibacillus qinlingensis]NQX63410.1 AraC family transcriptional regulator [Paenibacillus qinlingensis]
MRLQRSKKAQTLIMMLLVASICMTVMGFVMYRVATGTLTEEAQNAYKVSLLRTQDRVESYFKQMDQAVLQFEKLPALETFSKLNGLNQKLDLVTLRDTIVRMYSSIDDVDNVALYSVGDKKLIGTSQQVTAAQDEYAEVIAKFESLHTEKAFFTIPVNQSPTSVYVRKLPIFQEEKTAYILFHINQRFFDHILGTYDNVKGNYFILDQDGVLMQNRGKLSKEQLLAGLSPSRQDESFASSHLFITQLKASNNGWVFGFAIMNDEFFTKINRIRNLAFLLAGCLLAVAAIGAFLTTNRLWRGWSDIVKLVNDTSSTTERKDVQRHPGEQLDEFGAIYEKMHQIKESRDELNVQVNAWRPEVRDLFIRNMLRKGLRSQEDRNRLEQYHIQLYQGAYSCFCIEIDQYKSMMDLYTDVDLYYFRYGISKVIKEVMDEHGTGVVTEHGEGRFLALFSLEESVIGEAQQQFLHYAEIMRDFIKQYFPFTVSIGISLVRKDYAYLGIASEEAEATLKHKLVAGANEVIPFEAYRGEPETGSLDAEPLPVLFRELENDIIYAIQAWDLELAYSYADRLNMLQGIRTLNYHWLHNKLTEMILSIYWTINKTKRHASTELFMNKLSQLATLEDWIACLKFDVIALLIESLKLTHNEHMQRVAQQTIAYIEAHNEEDPRLEDLCKIANVPASIVRQALKEVHEATYSDLVLISRIDKAQNWLKHTEMNIEEIASRLQYSNAQNFSRIFKKVVGIPPGQYRKEMKNEQSD